MMMTMKTTATNTRKRERERVMERTSERTKVEKTYSYIYIFTGYKILLRQEANRLGSHHN